MERLVEGAREPSSFLQWQIEMREKDLQEELAKIERRRLEGRISYEEAAMARTRIMERNQKTAQLKKEEVGKDHSTSDEKRRTHIRLHSALKCVTRLVTKAWLFSRINLKGITVMHEKCWFYGFFVVSCRQLS